MDKDEWRDPRFAELDKMIARGDDQGKWTRERSYVTARMRRELHAAEMRKRFAWVIKKRQEAFERPRTPDGQRFAKVK